MMSDFLLSLFLLLTSARMTAACNFWSFTNLSSSVSACILNAGVAMEIKTDVSQWRRYHSAKFSSGMAVSVKPIQSKKKEKTQQESLVFTERIEIISLGIQVV